MFYSFTKIIGMFAIKTGHAASLTRDVPDFMTWTSRTVYLAWLGFTDLHSKVDYYMISIGSSYMASDLNQVCTLNYYHITSLILRCIPTYIMMHSKQKYLLASILFSIYV